MPTQCQHAASLSRSLSHALKTQKIQSCLYLFLSVLFIEQCQTCPSRDRNKCDAMNGSVSLAVWIARSRVGYTQFQGSYNIGIRGVRMLAAPPSDRPVSSSKFRSQA